MLPRKGNQWVKGIGISSYWEIKLEYDPTSENRKHWQRSWTIDFQIRTDLLESLEPLWYQEKTEEGRRKRIIRSVLPGDLGEITSYLKTSNHADSRLSGTAARRKVFYFHKVKHPENQLPFLLVHDGCSSHHWSKAWLAAFLCELHRTSWLRKLEEKAPWFLNERLSLSQCGHLWSALFILLLSTWLIGVKSSAGQILSALPHCM